MNDKEPKPELVVENPYTDRMDQLNHDYLHTLGDAGMDPIAVFVIRKAPEMGEGKVLASAMNVRAEILGLTENQIHVIVASALRRIVQDTIVAHPEAFNLPKADA